MLPSAFMLTLLDILFKIFGSKGGDFVLLLVILRSWQKQELHQNGRPESSRHADNMAD
jgi:hypothetical protein